MKFPYCNSWPRPHPHTVTKHSLAITNHKVSADGQNSIIVILGANDLLTPADVATAEATIKAAKVVVCQHEVPIETTIAALRLADAAGITSIFNPAPAQVHLSLLLLLTRVVTCTL